MAKGGADWTLEGFTHWLEIWEMNEPASAVYDHLRVTVISWILGRYSDPYQGMRRDADVDNLWFSAIPGTEHGGEVVCCSYLISEATRTVRCASIMTLSMPV
ncbi:hypothetical protein [Streptosporangium roseum]|uniref:hypothetical protein n=1 Tax=Streptosporangium roseum TaxID=2001 RepID=UPI0033287AA3